MKKLYYILFAVTLAIAALCGYGMLHVRVNSDMTKYLPDDSPMAEGLNVLRRELPGTDPNMGTVQLMFVGDSTATPILAHLKQIPKATSASVRLNEPDSTHTLYTLIFPGDANLAPITRNLHSDYPDAIIESSQDGVTPPISAIVIAALLVSIILLVMAQSWLDPVLYLLTIGIAVLINMGSNALLPSVSVTTNYIVAILQMVLALDYAIILMNRYRQEYKASGCDDSQLVASLTRAVHRACPSILSSSLTTVVGLAMLCFMRLKIGMDLGIVLAKGVLCCLICTFTVMPAFILLFHRTMLRTGKRTLVIPTDGISLFAARFKYPIAIFTVVLFGVTYYYSGRTNIYFCTSGEGQIETVFPKTNPVVLLYSTAEEQRVIALADSLLANDGVQQVVSYPTLFLRQHSAEEMCAYFQTLSHDYAEFIPGNLSMDMVTPDLMRLLYYMHSGAADTLRVSFSAMMHFINDDCLTNPLFDKFISPEMREQSAMLSEVMAAVEAPKTPAPKRRKATPKLTLAPAEVVLAKAEPSMPALPEPTTPEATNADGSPVLRPDTPVVVPVPAQPLILAMRDDSIPLSEFMVRYFDYQPDGRTEYLRNITDTAMIHLPMNASEISAFVGSTEVQTKMALRMAGIKGDVSPIEYVHVLSDDLFLRPGMVGMVTKKQRAEFARIVNFMDLANHQAVMTIDELSALLADHHGYIVPLDTIRLIAGIEPLVPDTLSEPLLADAVDTLAALQPATPVATPVIPTEPVEPPAIVLNTIKPAPAPAKPAPAPVQKEAKPAADDFDPAQFFSDLMTGHRTFTSSQMAANFRKLGYNLDEATLHLLYAYYGHAHSYDSLLTMSPEQLLNYAVDTLLTNPVIGSYLDEESLAMIANGRSGMDGAVSMIRGEQHSMMAILTTLPAESDETYEFITSLRQSADSLLDEPCYLIGEGAMYDEMKRGFNAELSRISWLTILAIFLIVAFTFRSIVIPIILILVVMTAVYVDVIFSGIINGGMLYLAYLISQSILMGATIDYGILFTNYYREYRKTHSKAGSSCLAYRGSIRTIMTSGTIMTLAPGAMALLVHDAMISPIVMCIAIGAFAALALILLVVPGTLNVFDRWVTGQKKK